MDRNFVLGAGALIASILKHNPDINFLFHVFTKEEDIEFIDKEMFVRLLNNKQLIPNFKYKFYTASILPLYKKLQNAGINMRRIIQATRLFSPSCCETISDRILYLDADILCLGSIAPLLDFNFNGKAYAASLWNGHEENTPDKLEGKYLVNNVFCAGVMLIDIEAWKRDINEEKLIDFIIKENPKYTDQTALNVVYDDKYARLADCYDSFNSIKDDTVLLHYVSQKLWEPWNFNAAADILSAFRKYAKLFEPDVTKWVSFKKEKAVLVNLSRYDNPESRYASKWMYKHMLKKRKYKGFMYFLMKHIYLKIKQKGVVGLLLLKSNTGS
ncbi:MAG: hypothetical protein J5934_03815 [Succinivibrio sp.]|nr:hypothetical protein [Succinivibrio sp.]